MKILFLDFDGVLNCGSTKERWQGFIGLEPKKIKLVEKILLETDARVVISSTWRLQQDWKDALIQGGGQLIVDRAVGVTPNMPLMGGAEMCERGKEIKDWLDNVGKEKSSLKDEVVMNYAILDDSSDMLPEQKLNNFFQTSWGTGLTKEIADRVIRFLNCKIRCNNCYSYYQDEGDLKIIDVFKVEITRACRNCKTDEFLMDI